MYRAGSPNRQRASRLQNPQVLKPSVPTGGVGSELKAIFSEIGIKICGSCGDKAAEWDRRGVEWCRKNRQTLIQWLIEQAAKREVSLLSAATELAKHHPALAAKIAALKVSHPFTNTIEIAAGSIVDFAISEATAKFRVDGPIPVVVSVSPREHEVHRRTFESVKNAGFDQLYATCEPGDYEYLPYAVPVFHRQKMGQWRNFINALRIGIETKAPYFITSEDDVEFCGGLSAFVRSAGWPSSDCGCLQLYSAEPLKVYPRGRRSRLADMHALDLLGACALMFRRDAAIAVEEWSVTKGWRGDTASVIEEPEGKQAADTFVGEVLTFLGYSIWAHNPSLVNHIGETSTLGHRNNTPNRRTLAFPGIDADIKELFSAELKCGS